MKFVVSSSELYFHLQAISRVINPKSAIPVLECFHLTVKDKFLSIKASDTETTLITKIDLLESDGDGFVAISSKTLMDALRELPEQPLTFSIDTSTMQSELVYQNGKYSFMSESGEEYPEMKKLSEDSEKLSMPVSILKDGITKTIFAAADDDSRPVMSSVVLDVTTENITFVASDAHELVKLTDTSVKGDKPCQLKLPKKPANILKGILAKEKGDVEIEFDSENVVIRLEKYTMICRLQEGRFPNYDAVIPKNNPYKVIVDRLSFLSTIKRVSVFASEVSEMLKISIKDNKMFLSSQDLDFSTAAQETIACQYEGEQIEIGFKSPYLIDIISNLSSEEIELQLGDPSRAGVIVPVQKEENKDQLMLLMPMIL